MVAGPQIGYYYPGLTMEVDLHGPGIDARGATAATIGYVLIGRSEDYAWSLTSAGLDIVDTYVETLVRRQRHQVRVQGTLRRHEALRRGGTAGDARSTHRVLPDRPRPGRRVRDGERAQGRSRRRSAPVPVATHSTFCCTATSPTEMSTTWATSSVSPPNRRRRSTPSTSTTATSVCSRAGSIPIRPDNVDPGLPIDGRGNEEWQGFVSCEPASARHQSAERSDRQLEQQDDRRIPGARRQLDRSEPNSASNSSPTISGPAAGKRSSRLTAAMNKAATQDVRVMLFEPLLAAVLKTGAAPGSREAADARPPRQVARERWQPPRPEPRRQDRRSRRRDHGRRVDEARRRVGRARFSVR